MPELLDDYLPLVIFIGVAVVHRGRADGRAVHRRLFAARSREAVRL